MNILDLFPDGTVKLAASTNGGEWCGACPWCEGNDRFRIWPNHPNGLGGRYWCRGCDRSGTLLDLLVEFSQLNRWDAIKRIGDGKPECSQATSMLTAEGLEALMSGSLEGNSLVWQERAAWFLADCTERMVPESRGLAYASKRHLRAETISTFGIGWNSCDIWEPRERWGLPHTLNDQGNPKKVWLPEGLVIPSRGPDGISAIKIRRSKWIPGDDRPKYVAVAGSSTGIQIRRGSRRPVMIVESELDAMLLWQEVGDLIDALALGTAQRGLGQELMDYIQEAPLVLVSLDYDEAGIAAARKWRQYPNAQCWPVPRGKDVGDIANTPGLIREWVEMGLTQPLSAKH